MRLGLDIGTNSIGWWLYKTEQNNSPVSTIDCGVRIFSDGRKPTDKSSLAVDRREARAARRRRDRFLRRRTVLMKELAETGLMPKDPDQQKQLEILDPYALRAKGLIEKLPLTHLGRAFFHINQRRGFKSNRKTDAGDNEAGKISFGADRLEKAMMTAGAKTYGEFLHDRRLKSLEENKTPIGVRTRMTTLTIGEKTEDGYDFYPTRNLLEEEFNALWEAQQKFHNDALSEKTRERLFEIIFYQRPLKAQKVGRCFFEEEERLSKAHPLFQRRVLYETVNSLRICEAGKSDETLTKDQRDNLIMLFDAKAVKTSASANVTFKQMKKHLKLNPNQSFSHESENRKGIDCDRLRALLSHTDRLGPRWSELNVDQQWAFVEKLQSIEDPAALHNYLTDDFGLSKDHALNVARTTLPEGHGRIGLTATIKILEKLKEDVVLYSEAATSLYGDHRGGPTGEIFDSLPYYGEILDSHVIPGTGDTKDDEITRFGRISNPTVHIGLNQLRRLLNKIIEVYGLPDQIVVELARDLKNSEKQKVEINRTIKKNTEAAIARGEKLESELKIQNTGANRILLRLWEDLNEDPLARVCVYSGKTISQRMVFDGSCDIDHILPYAQTLDDSVSNKIICLKEANRQKGNQSPWEVWGGTKQWDIIEPLIKNLPKNKQWRFAPNAMMKAHEDGSFLDRQLTDTQYLSRIAKEYLTRLYPGKESSVRVSPGRLTEMLRRHWGLNSLLADSEIASKKKNRNDHRHHALDAAVLAVVDQSLVQKISKVSASRRNENLENVVAKVLPPWESFRNEIKKNVDKINVSHRVDHGKISTGQTTARLHNDTAYGLTGDANSKGLPLVVSRKPIEALEPNKISDIRDEDLKAQLYQATEGLEGKQFTAAIKEFSEKEGPYKGIRRVRLMEPLNVIGIKDKTGKIYKGYKGDSNHCVEVWELPDKSWKVKLLSTFDAHQAGLGSTRPHHVAKLKMRLFKKDTVFLNHAQLGKILVTVIKFRDGSLTLSKLNEANVDARNRLKEKVFISLGFGLFQKSGLTKIHINELGHISNTLD